MYVFKTKCLNKKTSYLFISPSKQQKLSIKPIYSIQSLSQTIISDTLKY